MANAAMRKTVRRGETEAIAPQRKQRFYAVDNQWYFRLRGEADKGPFTSYAKARNELAIYLRRSGIVHFSL